MKRMIGSFLILSLLAAISAFACPNPRPSPIKIQSPVTDEEIDPTVGTACWAIVDNSADDAHSCGDSYWGYKFLLYDVTNNNTLVSTRCNVGCPTPSQIGFDGIDQWSCGNFPITWQDGTTYRIELWKDDDPSTMADESACVDCVTFHTTASP